jgi:hypothetical protein
MKKNGDAMHRVSFFPAAFKGYVFADVKRLPVGKHNDAAGFFWVAVPRPVLCFYIGKALRNIEKNAENSRIFLASFSKNTQCADTGRRKMAVLRNSCPKYLLLFRDNPV